MSFDASAVRHVYETIADAYAVRFSDDLEHSALDARVLEAATHMLPPSALVLDLGCGPGQVTSYLIARQYRAVGIDLTPKMLDVARRANPLMSAINGDLLRLPVRDGAVDGAIAWFALHHLPRSLLGRALGQVRRLLQPGGVFVLATHGGDGEEFIAHQWLGRDEQVPVTYYTVDQLRSELGGQQFRVEEVRSRPPMGHEYAATKVFVTATAA